MFVKAFLLSQCSEPLESRGLLQNSIGAGWELWAEGLGKLEILKPGKINAEGIFFYFVLEDRRVCWSADVLCK